MSIFANLQLLINDKAQKDINDIRVALPCKVDSYDKAKQTVDVKPLIKQPTKKEDGTYKAQSIPVIPSVPVMFPRAGGMFITFPIHKGDNVLVVFCDYSLDVWWTKGGEQDPQDANTHRFAGAVAIPGLYAEPDKLSDVDDECLVLGSEDGAQIFIKDEVHLGEKDPDEYVALAGKTLDEMTKIKNYLQGIHTILTGPPIPEPGMGAPSALQTALGAAVAGGLPSLQEPAAELVKAK